MKAGYPSHIVLKIRQLAAEGLRHNDIARRLHIRSHVPTLILGKVDRRYMHSLGGLQSLSRRALENPRKRDPQTGRWIKIIVLCVMLAGSVRADNIFTRIYNAIAGKSSQLTITTGNPLPPGTVGVPYSATLIATGGETPYTWAVIGGALPAGLGMTGPTIQGTPANGCPIAWRVRVTDNTGKKAEKSYTLTPISPLRILTTSLPDGQVGVPYHAQLEATGGCPPIKWSVR